MDGHIGNTVQLSTFLTVLNFKMRVLMSNTGQSCKCRIQDHLSELPEEHSYALSEFWAKCILQSGPVCTLGYCHTQLSENNDIREILKLINFSR